MSPIIFFCTLIRIGIIFWNASSGYFEESRTVGNRRRIVFGELAGKTGAAYLMAMMGLKEDADAAKRMALGLKDLRMGDLIDMPLDERVQKKIIGDKNGSDGGE